MNQTKGLIVKEININKYYSCTKRHKRKPHFRFIVLYRMNNQIITSEVSMLILLDNQKVSVVIQPVSVKGNPAVLDDIPVWSVSDETLVSVVPAEDGMSAVVTAVGPIGAAQVTVKGDADLGEGVVEITGILDIEILASDAATFVITPGTPELA